jgi:phosphate transport system permease protein
MTAPTAPPPVRPARPPSAPGAAAHRRRRRPAELDRIDYGVLVGSAVSALAFTWLVFTKLTEGVGWFGFVLATYVVFLGIFALVSADRVGRLTAGDRVATVVITTGAVVLLVPLLSLIGYVVVKGLPALRATFFTHDQRGVLATDKATAGGGAHALVGSLIQVGLALIMTVPLAIAVAVFLNETRSRFKRPVQIMIDAMSGLPSVVAGLFIYAVFVIPYGQSITLFGYNGFMASLALSMVMLPTITRTIEVVLRLVPNGLRESGLALGASRARVVWSVVLPTARTGMATAIVLGIARAVGETAPLLFTAFGSDVMNSNPFADPQESLPLFVWRNIRQQSEAAIQRGFAGALVLMLIVLVLFAIARFIGRERGPGSRRTRRRNEDTLEAITLAPQLGQETIVP